MTLRRECSLCSLEADLGCSGRRPIPSSAVGYYAYGSVRNGSTSALPTDCTYTGQEQDTTGLMYFRARYMDPALGTFVSPDTIVPEPGRAVDYNRFAYTRNNPLRYLDPSGHVAICFQGASGSGEADMNGAIMQMCGDLAERGYLEGAWFGFNNTLSQLWEAYHKILAAKEANPAESVTIVGYSYGGAAALELAKMLNTDPVLVGKDPVRVGTLITIEPVTFARSLRTFGWNTSGLSDNVDRSLNLWAGETEEKFPDGYPVIHGQPAPFLNGQEEIEGALNVQVVGRVSEVTNHFSIMYPETETDQDYGYNVRTFDAIRVYLSPHLFQGR